MFNGGEVWKFLQGRQDDHILLLKAKKKIAFLRTSNGNLIIFDMQYAVSL